MEKNESKINGTMSSSLNCKEVVFNAYTVDVNGEKRVYISGLVDETNVRNSIKNKPKNKGKFVLKSIKSIVEKAYTKAVLGLISNKERMKYFADPEGKIYFIIDGERFYISKDTYECVDEAGILRTLTLTDTEILVSEGIDYAPSDFPYRFVSEEKEDAYINKLYNETLEGAISLETNPFYMENNSSKVVDFRDALEKYHR